MYKEKGYTLLKSYPSGYLLMVTATGKTVAKYATKEEASKAIAELPEATPPQINQAETVKWRIAAQTIAERSATCVNGYGPSCFCLAGGEMELDYYFCWIPTCHQKAACLGSCPTHLGETKIHGDRSSGAAIHTQSHVDNDTYQTILDVVRRGQVRAVTTKPATMDALMKAGPPPSPSLDSLKLPIGMLLRRLGNPGNHTWALFDKDGHILGEHEDGHALVRLLSE